MKKTLLQIVQDILNDLDSDEVNSIDDTVESQQVASIVRQCFEELTSNRNWPHQRKLIQLTSLSDPNKPNYLVIPEDVKELESFSYDKQKITDGRINIQEVKYKEPDDFLRYIAQRDSSNPNVKTVTDFSGIKLLILNDTAPTYWTSFDDDYVITDSYDSAVDTTMSQTKTQCVAYLASAWVHTDEAVPDLPTEAFSLLQEEAKSTAFLVLKQMANQKAEQKASRQNRWLARKAWRAKGGVQYDDYGRKGRR